MQAQNEQMKLFQQLLQQMQQQHSQQQQQFAMLQHQMMQILRHQTHAFQQQFERDYGFGFDIHQH